MRTFALLGALALASCGVAAAPAMAIGDVIVIGAHDQLGPEVTISPARIDRDTIEAQRSAQRDARRWARGKRPQAKPRKRSNRLHVSRRTRRRHHRAA